jgi:hypothetical protein
MMLNYTGNPARYLADSDESDSKNGKVWMQQ